MPEMIMPSSSSSSSSSDREGKEISLDQTPNPNQITDLNQVLIFFASYSGDRCNGNRAGTEGRNRKAE